MPCPVSCVQRPTSAFDHHRRPACQPASLPASHDGLAHQRPFSLHHSRSFNSCGSVSSRQDDACDQHRWRPRHVGSGAALARSWPRHPSPAAALPFTGTRPQPHFISPSHHPSPHLRTIVISPTIRPAFLIPQTRCGDTWPPPSSQSKRTLCAMLSKSIQIDQQ
ncbi:hypothetical protein BKA80DRAFT_259248 [Phyllosticta citrichinensis]